MKTLKYLGLTALTIMLLNNCTNTDTNTSLDTQTEEVTSSPTIQNVSPISTPKVIGFIYPKVLETEQKSQTGVLNKKILIDKHQSIAFNTLKTEIANTKDISNAIKIQYLLINHVIDDINAECTLYDIDEKCSIEAGMIQLDVNDELIEELRAIDTNLAQKFADEYNNTTYDYGAIYFTKLADTNDYQYIVAIDMSRVDSSTKITMMLKWSTDLTNVDTSYIIQTDEVIYTFLHHYKKMAQEEAITLSHTFLATQVPTHPFNYTFILSLEKLNDANETYLLDSSYKTDDDTSILNQYGTLHKHGGSLKSTGIDSNEIEYFDAAGNVEKRLYCIAGDDCSLDDMSTWITHVYTPIYINNIPLDVSNPNAFIGIYTYYLIPNTIDNSEINLDNMESHSVGYVGANMPEGDTASGILYDDMYIDKLNLLDIYEYNPNTMSIIKINNTDIILSISQ